jgi:predicted MFS family arabinose efflux permease
MKSQRQSNLLSLLSYLTLGVMGGIFNLYGGLLTGIAHNFNVRVDTAGNIVSALFIGYLCTVMAAGHLADRLGKVKMIITGLAIIIFALLGFTLVSAWFLAVLMQVLIGFGLGSVISSSVGLVSELNETSRSSALGITQGAVAAGSVGAYGLSVLVLEHSYSWRAPIIILLALSTLLFLIHLTFLLGSSTLDRTPRSSPMNDTRPLLHSLIIRLLILINATTVGSQTLLSTYSAAYLELILGSRASAAALAPLAFWLGLLIGRGLYSMIIESLNQDRLWLSAGCLAAVSILLASILRSASLIIVLVGLAGIFLGSQVPGALARSNTVYPRQTGLASGVLFASAGVGSVTMVTLGSLLSHIASLEAILWLSLLSLTLSLVIMLIFVRKFPYRLLNRQ